MVKPGFLAELSHRVSEDFLFFAKRKVHSLSSPQTVANRLIGKKGWLERHQRFFTRSPAVRAGHLSRVYELFDIYTSLFSPIMGL
jgi:hypothetical protein